MTLSELKKKLQNKINEIDDVSVLKEVEVIIDIVSNGKEDFNDLPLYPSYKNKRTIRKCVLNKQVTLYYRLKNKEIQKITVFDKRKNPHNLKLV